MSIKKHTKKEIIIADDHEMVRLGIRSIIESIDGVKVVGEAKNGKEALALIKELKPDIALLDIDMPIMSGLEVSRRLSESNISTQAFILSSYDHPNYVLQSIEYGCKGYLMKNAEPAELKIAIEALINGDVYFSEKISKIMMKNLVNKEKVFSKKTNFSLTNREFEITKLITEGLTPQNISKRLEISSRTVETHKANIYKKFKVNNLAQLIRFAFDKGIISKPKK